MARGQYIKILRTTRTNLEIQKSNNNLLDGEPYYITDECKLAIGTGVNTYVDLNIYSHSFTITNPTASSDRPLWRVPRNITITAIHVLSDAVIVGQLYEYDSNGLNGTTIDADITTTANTNTNDDGNLSNANIAAGNYLGWKTTSVSGTPTWATITFEYY